MMKFLSILAAASLALTPVIASAGSGGENTEITDDGRPISGPLAVQVLEQPIPVGAIAGVGDNEMAAKHYQIALANGKNSLVTQVAQDGNSAPRRTTVAKVAEENLACLSANICQAPR